MRQISWKLPIRHLTSQNPSFQSYDLADGILQLERPTPQTIDLRAPAKTSKENASRDDQTTFPAAKWLVESSSCILNDRIIGKIHLAVNIMVTGKTAIGKNSAIAAYCAQRPTLLTTITEHTSKAEKYASIEVLFSTRPKGQHLHMVFMKTEEDTMFNTPLMYTQKRINHHPHADANVITLYKQAKHSISSGAIWISLDSHSHLYHVQSLSKSLSHRRR